MIQQTFVRLPKIEAVRYTNEMKGQCELKGEGIDYIGRVSTDEGKTWHPAAGQMLLAQLSADGKTTALIPLLTDKKLLQIKLRDYSNTEGIGTEDFTISNSIRNNSTKKAQSQAQNQMPNQSNNNSATGQFPNQPNKEKPERPVRKKQRRL